MMTDPSKISSSSSSGRRGWKTISFLPLLSSDWRDWVGLKGGGGGKFKATRIHSSFGPRSASVAVGRARLQAAPPFSRSSVWHMSLFALFLGRRIPLMMSRRAVVANDLQWNPGKKSSQSLAARQCTVQVYLLILIQYLY